MAQNGREKMHAELTACMLWMLPLIMLFVCMIVGIKLAIRGNSTGCIQYLQWCFMAMGLVFIGFYPLTFAVSKCSRKAVPFMCVCFQFSAYIVFLGLMIAAFLFININNDKPPYPEPDKSNDGVKLHPVHEYNLTDYNGRLRHRMAEVKYWANINACLRKHACDGMSPLVRDPDTGKFLAERRSKKSPYDNGLSPIESGCCKPPLSCGFTYVNQTTWTLTPGAVVTNNSDCSRWSNDQQTLCFQCDSCKAGVLADIQRAWSKIVMAITSILVMVIVVVPCFACCAHSIIED